MQKYLIYALMLLSIKATAQFYYYPLPPGKEDYKRNELAGVKICYEYKLESGEKLLNSILEYGSRGLPAVLFEKGIDENGDSITISEIAYKYNTNLTLNAVTTDDFESGSRSTAVYTYDKNGRLIKKEIASIDPPTYTYKYNPKGQLAEVNISVEIPSYDDEGNPTGKSFQKPQTKLVYKYNAQNRIAEELYFLADENNSFSKTANARIRWKYNPQNLATEITAFDSEEAVTLLVNLEYNKSGLLSKQVRKMPGEDEEIYIYEYCKDCKQSWMQ